MAFWSLLEYQNGYYSHDYTTEEPILKWTIDETFYKVMRYRVGISVWLNIQSTIMNLTLLLFLFSYKEFRSWLFFPLMMQATVDIVGPGIANMIYEWQLYFNWPNKADEFALFSSEPIIDDPQSLEILPGPFACVLIHLRSLLNEYSTGYCLLATALFRYVLVCHPSVNLTTRFYKKVAVALVSIPCVAMVGSAIDLLFNDYGYSYNPASSIDLYGNLQYSKLVHIPL